MKTHAKTHGLRRFLCGLTALAAAALMVPLSAMAETNPPDNGPDTNGVTVGKSATNLDANNQTTVTLDVKAGSEDIEERTGSNVVFVLDKSTSADVRSSAGAMLDELLTRVSAGNSVNVAVVSFESTADTVLNWTELSESTIDTIKSAIENKKNESGTNIQLGLEYGRELLEFTEGGQKYLVLVTDGITYQWNNGMTIYSEQSGFNEESLNAGNDMMQAHHPENFDNYLASFNYINTWMQTHGNKIDSDIETYQHEYGAGQYQPDEKGKGTESTYNNVGFSQENYDYIPGESLTTHYCANDAAVYMAVKEWKEIVDEGIHAYAYADITGDANVKGTNAYNANTYPWASSFVSSLSTVGGISGKINNSNVDGIFDDIKDDILSYTNYTIASGTVTDIIGEDFNFTGIDTLSLSVNGVRYAPTYNYTNNTVQFYNPDGQAGESAEFTVSYAINSNGEEVLTWDIDEEISGSVSLSYKLDVEPSSFPTGGASATLPTNESAVLEYKGTDGTTGTLPFPEPSITIGSEPEQGGDDDEDDNPPIVIPDNPSLTIRKIWENDSASDRPDSITVDIYHDGEYYDSMVISGLRFGNSDTWRDSYDIPARYEDDDWWVVESDVPAYYDSDVEEVRENVFYITNTYEEPVIEEPVSSEPESSEPSSEPSEVIPSGPSEEPSAPSSEPTSEPSEPAEPTLPQTGQTWWPIIILLAGGAVLVAFGAFRTMRGNSRHGR